MYAEMEKNLSTSVMFSEDPLSNYSEMLEREPSIYQSYNYIGKYYLFNSFIHKLLTIYGPSNSYPNFL